MRCRLVLAIVTLAVLAVPAPAGIFGKKTTKPDPKNRVPELIVIVKTDKDESKRADAAEELRQYDPKTFADIVPVLIDVLFNDPKPSVRVEAAQSLGKLRPVSMEAGWALEQALAKDASMKVRLQARSSLLQYHWAGYRSPDTRTKDGPVIESKEPPLAPGPGPSKTPAPPEAPPTSRPSGAGARPLPSGAPVLQPAPPSNPGPDLTPPAP